MCEPNHSVTQWAPTPVIRDTAIEVVSTIEAPIILDFLEHEHLTGQQMLPSVGDKTEIVDMVSQWFADEVGSDLGRLETFVGEDAKYLSLVDKFYHLSRFGEGHRESRVAKLGRGAFVPPYTAYEIQWWNREIKFDINSTTLNVRRNKGHHLVYQKIEDTFKAHALKACEKYALTTSIGSPQVLRRFLEETILTSNRLGPTYKGAFYELLSVAGRKEFDSRLKLAEVDTDLQMNTLDKLEKERLAKIICGLTRKRQFLCDAWADIPRFWSK